MDTGRNADVPEQNGLRHIRGKQSGEVRLQKNKMWD